MQSLATSIKTLTVQHGVDIGGAQPRQAISLFPRRAKGLGVLAAAEEAWPMSRRKGGGFIEKKQFGPASTPHHFAPPAPEFADAGEPGAAGPAPLQKGFGGGVVNDTAIAGEHATMGRRDDVTGGRHAVLQGHGVR